MDDRSTVDVALEQEIGLLSTGHLLSAGQPTVNVYSIGVSRLVRKVAEDQNPLQAQGCVEVN